MPPFLNIARKSMETNTKPAVQSVSLWALTSMAVAFLGEVTKYLGALPAGTLPTPVSYAVMGISWAVIVYRKIYGDNKGIDGVFFDPKN